MDERKMSADEARRKVKYATKGAYCDASQTLVGQGLRITTYQIFAIDPDGEDRAKSGSFDIEDEAWIDAAQRLPAEKERPFCKCGHPYSFHKGNGELCCRGGVFENCDCEGYEPAGPEKEQRQGEQQDQKVAWLASGDKLCHRCGADNPIWFAPSPLWNKVMRNPYLEAVVCLNCFVATAKEKGCEPFAWVLSVEESASEAQPSADFTHQQDCPCFSEGHSQDCLNCECQCLRPPRGWRCTREVGHAGPCAAVQVEPQREEEAQPLTKARIEHIIAGLELRSTDMAVDVVNALRELLRRRESSAVEMPEPLDAFVRYVYENCDEPMTHKDVANSAKRWAEAARKEGGE